MVVFLLCVFLARRERGILLGFFKGKYFRFLDLVVYSPG